jgi:signal transduction histidine kinase
VTEQHTLAQQREDFLAAAAHDLKTPLAAIKAVAQLLTRRAERDGSLDPEQLVDNLHRIETTATRMSHLINELLDGTRVYQSQPLELQRQPVDLVALMDRVCHEQRLSERFEIQCESETSELVGFWDEMRIERVIVNLISNAVKYSPEGGLILIRLRCEERRGQVWAVLTVEDQGMGIPAADLPHIFERFYRGSNVPRDIAGTGIGLAGVQQIVEQHGGSVLVESHEGKGSRFTVRLPLGSGE